jgi:hypothetical protein
MNQDIGQWMHNAASTFVASAQQHSNPAVNAFVQSLLQAPQQSLHAAIANTVSGVQHIAAGAAAHNGKGR